MDRKTAHDTYLQHRPSGWLAAIRIHRCADGCGKWPCNPWITARDQRARAASEAATNAAVALILGHPA